MRIGYVSDCQQWTIEQQKEFISRLNCDEIKEGDLSQAVEGMTKKDDTLVIFSVAQICLSMPIEEFVKFIDTYNVQSYCEGVESKNIMGRFTLITIAALEIYKKEALNTK